MQSLLQFRKVTGRISLHLTLQREDLLRPRPATKPAAHQHFGQHWQLLGAEAKAPPPPPPDFFQGFKSF